MRKTSQALAGFRRFGDVLAKIEKARFEPVGDIDRVGARIERVRRVRGRRPRDTYQDEQSHSKRAYRYSHDPPLSHRTRHSISKA